MNNHFRTVITVDPMATVVCMEVSLPNLKTDEWWETAELVLTEHGALSLRWINGDFSVSLAITDQEIMKQFYKVKHIEVVEDVASEYTSEGRELEKMVQGYVDAYVQGHSGPLESEYHT